MWPSSWSKTKIRNTPPPKSTTSLIPSSSSSISSPSTPSLFSCSSFKDIQSLLADENTSNVLFSIGANNITRKGSIFHRVRLASSILRAWSPRPPEERISQPPQISIPGAENRIIVYYTSLRVVRSTFEDCRYVRSVLRSFRVQIDERDLSMDSAFQSELRSIFGGRSKVSLPRVFIGGRYIGGAEEVRQLHEAGELKKFVEGLNSAAYGVCDVCGGYGFVLCGECDGSHKLYAEKAGGFKSCGSCNENGLIRCSSCLAV